MKIGVVTFHCARNYGAVLQCRALCEVLRNLGHEVHVIDHRPSAITAPYQLWKSSFLKHPVKLLKVALGYPAERRRKKAFERFEESFLLVPPTVKGMDAVLYGSDQVWNPRITGGDVVYFGESAPQGAKRIAYAASCGPASLPQDILKRYLPGFHRIGVRERSLQDVLRAAGFDSQVTLDPVLLAGDLLLESVRVKCPEKKGYVLTYEATDNPQVYATAAEVARERGLRVVSVSRSPYARGCGKYGPEEFVALIREADYVVTSSFHAVAFALLMHKDYHYCPSGTGADDRIFGLLAQVKEKGLDALRAQSMAFLQEALQ